MRENPTWYVPKSIQDEWAQAGKVVKKTASRAIARGRNSIVIECKLE
jgi:hypothetical protein